MQRSRLVCLQTLALVTALVLVLGALASTAHARSYDAEEMRLLEVVNAYRSQHGIGALLPSDIVAEAAARHALDMGRYGFFSHISARSSFFPVGSSPLDRMRLMGYGCQTAVGENIAAGYRTAQQVFQAWKGSPGHNRNMLDSSFRVIGIACRVTAGSPYGVYWTADFGSTPVASAPGETPTSTNFPFTDVTKADPELWQAAIYVKERGLFEGYASGALGCWDFVTRRHVALVLERAGLGSWPAWEQDHATATRGEVRAAFPDLAWTEARVNDNVLRSQLVRLLYRAR